MATAGAGLEVEGVEKFDSLSQQIEDSFIEYHNLLDTHKVKLRELKRDKDKLDSVCELKFVPNTEELIVCVKKIHLRDSLYVEYNKRRDPIVMKGVGEEDLVYVRAIAVDKEMDLVYVTDYYNCVVNVYSTEGDFIRKIVSDKLYAPYGISLSDEFVFVSNSRRENVVKFSKAGVYLSDSKTVNKDLSLTMCRNMCTYNNQTLYVCNHSENRIEVFGLDLSYTGNFGGEEIHHQTDIKTHSDMIFVLDYKVRKIHTYNTEHILSFYPSCWIQFCTTLRVSRCKQEG